MIEDKNFERLMEGYEAGLIDGKLTMKKKILNILKKDSNIYYEATQEGIIEKIEKL